MNILMIVGAILASLSAIAFTVGIPYLVWVLIAWGIISAVVAFGGAVAVSPWALSFPLWLCSLVIGSVFNFQIKRK